jgi:hypothetical protein
MIPADVDFIADVPLKVVTITSVPNGRNAMPGAADFGSAPCAPRGASPASGRFM